jgi:signal transduction histidine kinase
LDFLSPGSVGLVRARADALRSGASVPRVELRLRRGDGREIEVEVMETAHRDVTARREMQGQIQIASRLAALGTLAAGIAHEVNNPLARVMASQALAIEALGEPQATAARGGLVDQPGAARELAEIEEALDEGLTASIRIARFVRELTVLGSPDPRRNRVRLADVVDGTIGWLAASVHSRALVRVESGDAPDVTASRGQLGQVVVSLVANAASAIPEGQRGAVTIRVGRGNRGTATLEVEDDGEGIAPEVMARMLDPFFTTRTVGKRMGLGLSVSHAIVAAHGGTLSATSEPGKGSTFRVELPAAGVPA